ncbi:MAG TPA: redox-sensing transcriptional repressor Rex [Bacteroidales bacterium]|jgi:redox-sensing transcriptional repressor|nr:redox-sensing transcriptional repressor Rex [Bacteroidales bacterium]
MLPEKTIERLSQYRRLLLANKQKGKENIFSHEIAVQLHLTSVQVRRDIMLIGYSGTQRKGYNIDLLIEKISSILDDEKGLNSIIIGMGNLGKAISTYFYGKRNKIDIVAAFDIDIKKTGRLISGVWCYHTSDLETIIKEKQISLAILALAPEAAQDITDRIIFAGVKGILNFTSVPLNVLPNVYLENYDMVTSLEKVAYFVKENHLQNR